MIELKNLHFSYKDKEILKIKNLKLDTSKISVLMGENGSGKSTLLRILKFLEGEFENITYFGKNKLSSKQKREIYLLFSEPTLLNRSVKDNFYFNLKTYEVKDGYQKRIDEVLTWLELDKTLLKKMPCELSSGQKQKIAFAIALSLRAKYYLLDEPSSFLDKQTSILFKKAILKMHEKFKCGFLIASHDKNFLDSLAQIKFYLHSGEILEFENTNVFELENQGLAFSNFIDFSICKTFKAVNNPKKIAINPYKIELGVNKNFVIEKCQIIALRTKKEYVYIRVISAEKILEFTLLKEKFLENSLNLYEEIKISFDEDAIYFLT